MRSVRHSSKKNSDDNLLHIETDGAIINVRVGLRDAEGRKVTSIEIIPDDEQRSPDLDGRHWDLADKAPRNIRIVRRSKTDEIIEKVRRTADAEYELSYVDRSDDGLRPAQVTVLLQGDNPYESDEFSMVETLDDDNKYSTVRGILKELLTDDEYDRLDGEPDSFDEARFIIEERDTSDIIDLLLGASGSMLVRYRLDVESDVDDSTGDDERRVNAVDVLSTLGVQEPTAEQIEAVMAIQTEGGRGEVYMIWYADVQDLYQQAMPFQQARFEGVGQAPAAHITFTDCHLLVLDRLNGAGYDSRLPGTFSIPFDAAKLVTDEGDSGYSWNETAGLSVGGYRATVTITADTVEEPAGEESQSQ